MCIQGDNIPKDLSYTLKRLVRGLGATKQLIQKGYFTALVSILDAFPSITPDIFIDNVDKELGCSKNASKSVSILVVLSFVLYLLYLLLLYYYLFECTGRGRSNDGASACLWCCNQGRSLC